MTFQNVMVEYLAGKHATLTIYHDGEEHEKVDLEAFESEAEMVQMMLDKGFISKSEEEVRLIRKTGAESRVREQDERNERMEDAKRRMEAYRKMKAIEKEKAQAVGGEL